MKIRCKSRKSILKANPAPVGESMGIRCECGCEMVLDSMQNDVYKLSGVTNFDILDNMGGVMGAGVPHFEPIKLIVDGVNTDFKIDKNSITILGKARV